MKYNKTKIYLFGLIILGVDVITKILVQTFLKEEFVIIKNFFSFKYSQNTGAAFGILEGKQSFLLMITAAVLLILSKLIKDEKCLDRLSFWSYALLIGGILGNFIDRLINSYVVDFISFKLFGYRMPIFNLADTFIVVAVFLIIIEFVRDLYEDKSR